MKQKGWAIRRNNKGFTIIEVALVLAIAGLIFIVVFIAIPALQRSQSNNARRQEVQRIIGALQSYQVDHTGRFTSTLTEDDLRRYTGDFQRIDTIVTDATLANYADKASKDTAAVVIGAKCVNTPTPEAGSSLNAAVVIRLDTGDPGQLYCKSM